MTPLLALGVGEGALLFILGVFVGPFIIIAGLFFWARADNRREDKRHFGWMDKDSEDKPD